MQVWSEWRCDGRMRAASCDGLTVLQLSVCECLSLAGQESFLGSQTLRVRLESSEAANVKIDE
jgi:hypothetical protein